MSAYVDFVEDTICALITAPGKAGVSVHRVSGPNALELCRKMIRSVPTSPESHRVYLSSLVDRKGDIIDEALVTYFRSGRSFTGDETLEISTHGGLAIANKVLAELVRLGCRPAERGEFSFRAFYNGKLDLIQAEGILGLIHSETEAARKMSLKQLRGGLSEKITSIEDIILKTLSQLEASIDFSTEDIEPYSLSEMQTLVESAISQIRPLVESFQRGRVVNEGFKIVICGPPNAGKSSLYNAIIGKERSIVSELPGTTRDFIEHSFHNTGLPVHIVDTAGLRAAGSDIEAQGIRRSMDQIREADAVFIVLDANDYSNKLLDLPTPLPKETILIFNKTDLVDSSEWRLEAAADYAKSSLNIHVLRATFGISVENGVGIQAIKDLVDTMSLVDIDKNETLVTQYRQVDLLEKTLVSLNNAKNLIIHTSSYDLVAIEMQESLRTIYAVLGKEFDDQVLDRVFKEFCIGK